MDFNKITDTELLEDVPANANAVVEVDGAFKRVPGTGLGGGIKTYFYNTSEDAEIGLYTDAAYTVAATAQEVYAALTKGVVYIGLADEYGDLHYALCVDWAWLDESGTTASPQTVSYVGLTIFENGEPSVIGVGTYPEIDEGE